MEILALIPEAFAQEAVEGVNDAFGGTAGAMRNILDGIFGVEQAFADFFSFLKGTFLGEWD